MTLFDYLPWVALAIVAFGLVLLIALILRK